MAARLEPIRLAPEANVWFEPCQGQIGSRTECTARATGARLFLTSSEIVYPLPPQGTFAPQQAVSCPIG